MKHVRSGWFRGGTASITKSELNIESDELDELADELEIEETDTDDRVEKTKEVIDLVSTKTAENTDETILTAEPDSAGKSSYEVYEPELTVGNTVEPEYAPTPDVAPDGSIIHPDKDELEPEPQTDSNYGLLLLFIGFGLSVLVLLAVYL